MTDTAAPTRTLTTRDRLRRMVLVLFVLACLAGIGWGASQVREVDANGDVVTESNAAEVEITGDEELVPTRDEQEAAADLPSQAELVEQLFPSEGAEILQQQQVGIDLGSAYRATSFSVNGVVLSEDDLTRREELGQVFFQPGDGTPFEVLPPGRNCARAEVAGVEAPADVIRSVEWCFEVT